MESGQTGPTDRRKTDLEQGERKWMDRRDIKREREIQYIDEGFQ